MILITNLSVISDIPNSEIKLVIDWLIADKLSLNESKTKLLLFRPINNNLTLKLDSDLPKKVVLFTSLESLQE